MGLKFNITGLVAFLLLGGVIFLWGPGWQSVGRCVGSALLYAGIFFACFVVVKRR